MNTMWQNRIAADRGIRIIADALMISAALLTALVLRYLWMIAVEGSLATAQVTFQMYVRFYLSSFWLLTALSIVIFYLSGFYTHGRAYRGRYKALVVARAVTLSYVIFGFLVFVLGREFALPRSVLFLAWALTLLFLLGARLWATVWNDVIIQSEQRRTTSHSKRNEVERVLVIGGAGYIGSALLPKLLEKGYHVRVLDLLVRGTEPIAEVLRHPNLEVIKADFLQVDKVVEAMQDIDAVVHLGALVGDPACALDEQMTVKVNLMAARMIAEVAKGSGINRFVFASTCSVYGASDEILDEYSALNPVSLYARTKIASERALMQIANDHFSPVILRFGTVYGLSGRTRFDLVINLLTAKALFDSQITVFGGDQWRPFVHVDDAALAILMVLEAPLTLVRKQVFNVGSNEQNYTIQQVAEFIHRLVPTAELINMGSDTDRRNYRVNFSKIQRTLGFVPQWTVERGIQQVIDAIISGKVRDYRDSKYHNFKSLLRLQAVHKALAAYQAETDTVDVAIGDDNRDPESLKEPWTGFTISVDV